MSMTGIPSSADRYLDAADQYNSRRHDYAQVKLGPTAITRLLTGENAQDNKFFGKLMNGQKSALLANFIQRAAAIREFSGSAPEVRAMDASPAVPVEYASRLVDHMRAHMKDDAQHLLATEIAPHGDGGGLFTYTAKIGGKPWIEISGIPADSEALAAAFCDELQERAARELQPYLSVEGDHDNVSIAEIRKWLGPLIARDVRDVRAAKDPDFDRSFMDTNAALADISEETWTVMRNGAEVTVYCDRASPSLSASGDTIALRLLTLVGDETLPAEERTVVTVRNLMETSYWPAAADATGSRSGHDTTP